MASNNSSENNSSEKIYKSVNERKLDKIFKSYSQAKRTGKNRNGRNLNEINRRVENLKRKYRDQITHLNRVTGTLAVYQAKDFKVNNNGEYINKRLDSLDEYDLAIGQNVLTDSDHPYNNEEWKKDTEFFAKKALNNVDDPDQNILSWLTINPFQDNIGSPQSLVEFFFNMMMAYRTDLLTTDTSRDRMPPGGGEWCIPLPKEWVADGGILSKMMDTENSVVYKNLKKYGISLGDGLGNLNPSYTPNASYYIWEGDSHDVRSDCFNKGGVMIPYLLPVDLDIDKDRWTLILQNLFRASINIEERYVYREKSDFNLSIYGSACGEYALESGCFPVYVSSFVSDNISDASKILFPEVFHPPEDSDAISPLSAYVTNKSRLLYDIIYSQGIYNILDETIYGPAGYGSATTTRNPRDALPPKGQGFVNNGGILFNYSGNSIRYLNITENTNINNLPRYQAVQELVMASAGTNQFHRQMYKRWDTGRAFYNTMILLKITNPESLFDGQPTSKPTVKEVEENLIKVFNEVIMLPDDYRYISKEQKLNLFLFDNGLYHGEISNFGTVPGNKVDYAKFKHTCGPMGLFSVKNFEPANDKKKIGDIQYFQEETLLTNEQIKSVVKKLVDTIFSDENNILNDHLYKKLPSAEDKAQYKAQLVKRLTASLISVKEALFVNDISQITEFNKINIYHGLTTPLYNQGNKEGAQVPTANPNDRSKYTKKGQHIPLASTTVFRKAFANMMNKAILTVEAEKYSWDEVDHTKYNPEDHRQVVVSTGGDLSKLVRLDVSSILEMKLENDKYPSFMQYLQHCLDEKISLVNKVSEKGTDVGGLIQDEGLNSTVEAFARYCRFTQTMKLDVLDKITKIESKYMSNIENKEIQQRISEITDLKKLLEDNIIRPILLGRPINQSTVDNYNRLVLERVRDILQIYVEKSASFAQQIKNYQGQLQSGYRILRSEKNTPNIARQKSLEQLKGIVFETKKLTDQLTSLQQSTTGYVETLINDLLSMKKIGPLVGLTASTAVTRGKEIGKILDSIIDKIWIMAKRAGIHRRIKLANFGTKLENIYYFLDDIRDSVNFNLGGPTKKEMASQSNLDNVGLWVMYPSFGDVKTNLFDLLSGRRVKSVQSYDTVQELYRNEKLYGVIIGQSEASRKDNEEALYYVDKTPPENVTYKTATGREALIKYMKAFFISFPATIGKKTVTAGLEKWWKKVKDPRKKALLNNFQCPDFASCNEIFITKEDAIQVINRLVDLTKITPETRLIVGGGNGKKKIRTKNALKKLNKPTKKSSKSKNNSKSNSKNASKSKNNSKSNSKSKDKVKAKNVVKNKDKVKAKNVVKNKSKSKSNSKSKSKDKGKAKNVVKNKSVSKTKPKKTKSVVKTNARNMLKKITPRKYLVKKAKSKPKSKKSKST